MLPRVYFDTNEDAAGPDGWEYGLWLGASQRDLAAIPGGPKDGTRVVIYMTGELEMEAVLRRDPESGDWLANPVPGTIKHYY